MRSMSELQMLYNALWDLSHDGHAVHFYTFCFETEQRILQLQGFSCENTNINCWCFYSWNKMSNDEDKFVKKETETYRTELLLSICIKAENTMYCKLNAWFLKCKDCVIRMIQLHRFTLKDSIGLRNLTLNRDFYLILYGPAFFQILSSEMKQIRFLRTVSFSPQSIQKVEPHLSEVRV